LQKEIERLEEKLAQESRKSLLRDAQTIDGLKVVVQKMGQAEIEELLKAATLLAEADCVAVLGSETGKVVASVGRSGLGRGLKAGSIVKAAAAVLGGGGGGKPDLAQGGGPNAGEIDRALQAAVEAIKAGG
jgi:alanyl-tRNA synthetase